MYQRHQYGFTLIELIIVIGLFALLVAFGLPVAGNLYTDYVLISERDQFLAILRKTRNQALTNLDAQSHGVHIASTSYTVFEGATWAGRIQDKDENISRSSAVTMNGTSDIVFTALSGITASTSWNLSNGIKISHVTVNSEGTINW